VQEHVERRGLAGTKKKKRSRRSFRSAVQIPASGDQKKKNGLSIVITGFPEGEGREGGSEGKMLSSVSVPAAKGKS